MSNAAILHLDRSTAIRSLVAATHLRVAPGTALLQLSDASAAREFFVTDSVFDLVLVAHDLEEAGDGYAFVKWLRETVPAGPPIYILEDHLEPCFIVDAMEYGIEGVLPTADPAALANALEDLFELHLTTSRPRLL